MLAEYDHEVATTRKLIERVPDEKLTWKPHEKSMSFGGLAQHIASLPSWGAHILDAESFDLVDAPPPPGEPVSRADVLKRFETTTATARKSLDKTDGELMVPWTLKRAGQQIFTMPRSAAFRSFVLNHLIHHRGQLSVYLRLNDIPVPAIYGPSADEGQS
jgi:uncharacterized damage-inducible protein DinB